MGATDAAKDKPAPDCHCHICTDVCHSDIAGHFFGARSCQFFIHNAAGRYCVSTVGDYRPRGAREAVGHNRFYETYVFDKSAERRWSNIDGVGAQTEAEAKRAHAEMLAKYRAIAKSETH